METLNQIVEAPLVATVLIAFFFILIVDGLKHFINWRSQAKARRVRGAIAEDLEAKNQEQDLSQVSVLISAYKAAGTISPLLESFVDAGFYPENIHIANDGSPDNLTEVLASLKEQYPGLNVYENENQGKVATLKWLAPKVTTKYVLVSDSDNVLAPGFKLDLAILEEGYYTACAFNVVPFNDNENLLVGAQKFEYEHSMAQKEASSIKEGTLCMSGALALFISERYKKIMASHTGIYTGDDREATQREHLMGGSVYYNESVVLTECPAKLKSFSKQRFLGWDPGAYRCMSLDWKLLFQKGKSALLRYEIIYNFFAVFTDIFKIAGVVGCSFFTFFADPMSVDGIFKFTVFEGPFFSFTPAYFVSLWTVYVVYLLMNVLSQRAIKSKAKPGVMLFYPIYKFMTILIRFAAFFRYFYQRFITRQMKPTRASVILALMMFLPFLGKSQESKKQDSADVAAIGIKFQDIVDFRATGETNQINLQLYAGYKTLYAKSDLVVNPSLTIGKYYGNSEASVRFRSFDLDVNVFQYLPVLKYPNNLYVIARYMRQYESNTNIYIPGVAYERYLNDYHVVQARVLQKIGGDRNALSFHARYKYKKLFALYAGINQWGHKNVAAVISDGHGFSMGVSYKEQVDYYDFDRLTVFAGYTHKF